MFLKKSKKVLAILFSVGLISTATANTFSFTDLLQNILNASIEADDINIKQIYSKEQLNSTSFAACLDIFPQKRALQLNDYSNWKPFALCQDQFAVLYSGLTKTPLIVVEKMNSQMANQTGKLERTNKFYADTRLKKEYRSYLRDYKKSSYDRGHLAPAGNMTTLRAMTQSFALSNMVPQNPENNRKAWNKIESDVRKFIKRAKGNVYIFSGPIFPAQFSTIGKNKVAIPSHLFKIVYDEFNQKTWVYLVPNAPTTDLKPISYSQFQQLTGINLNFDYLK